MLRDVSAGDWSASDSYDDDQLGKTDKTDHLKLVSSISSADFCASRLVLGHVCL